MILNKGANTLKIKNKNFKKNIKLDISFKTILLYN